MAVHFSHHPSLGHSDRIYIENYRDIVLKIGISKLPDALISGHQFFNANIADYHKSESIAETINDYIRDLNAWVDKLPAKRQKEIFEKDTGYSGYKWTGSKYKQTQGLSTSEIAKLIKKELDIVYEDEAKFSVTSDVFTGGASINVSITDVSDNPYTDHFLKALQAGQRIEEYNQENKNHYNEYPERFNDKFKAFLKKVEVIANQYNFNDSDSQTDYFHVNYYNHVGFDENKYLIKHFPDSPDAKRHKEFNESWDKSRAKAKEKADASKGKFKKGTLVFYKAEMHSSWHKYKLPNGMYLAKITKSPNGRARFFSNYSIQILEDIKTLGEKTIEWHKKNGADKYYITNEYGTFYHSNSITAYERNMIALDDPAAKIEPVKEETPAKPKKERKNRKGKAVVEKPTHEPVTIDNYFDHIFDPTAWPIYLQQGHAFITGETEGFKNIELAYEDETIRAVINNHLSNLNSFLSQTKKDKPAKAIPTGTLVRQISLAVRFIKRYAGLDGKTLSEKELSAFIKTLQKAMNTQQIRATDPHQATILHIQDELVDTFNNIEPDTKIKFTVKDVEKYKALAKSENEMLSAKLLKRFVNLIDKKDKDKQRKLLKEIIDAFEVGTIPVTDVLKPQLENAVKSLQDAINAKGKLIISDAELSGLQGLGFIPAMIAAAVGKGIEHMVHKTIKPVEPPVSGIGCACLDEMPVQKVKRTSIEVEPKAEHHQKPQAEAHQDHQTETEPAIEQHDENAVMGVNQARALKFDLIGLDGMYLELIGEACRPTSFFIYGPGGSGKSSFTLLFSNYMAGKGNKVLYVAGEQHGTPVFTKMLDRLNIQDSPNFGIVKRIGNHDLTKYDIIAIDSKDSLNYSLDDFIHQREQNPHLTFVILSQGTKGGGFTGTEKWRNEVDTLIYCASLVAHTNQDKNRWGGSAEIDILKLVKKK